jgi:toluene monooxygenase system protein D
MADAEHSTCDYVGPVLQAGVVAEAVIAAIRQLNSTVVVLDRGAYQRVLVPQRCVITRMAVEAHLGRPLRFPGDLEKIMPAFQGSFTVSEAEAAWACRAAPTHHEKRC